MNTEFLTCVYRVSGPGSEASALMNDPRVSAAAWGHGLQPGAALAAQQPAEPDLRDALIQRMQRVLLSVRQDWRDGHGGEFEDGEMATMDAVRAVLDEVPEALRPVGWVLRYGALDGFHVDHPRGLAELQPFDTEAEALAAGEACGFNWEVLPVLRRAAASAVPSPLPAPLLQRIHAALRHGLSMQTSIRAPDGITETLEEVELLMKQPAACSPLAAQRDVRQADERGDEAMRRAHAAEDVLDLLVTFQAEYGRNALDPDGMPGNELYRPVLQAIVNRAKSALGDSAGSSKAMSTVKAWIDSAALADAMSGPAGTTGGAQQ